MHRPAVFITLLMVPGLYAIFVFDLKLVKWELRHEASPQHGGTFASGPSS
ncbi:MAG: hypothetical protein ABIP39_03360 [Polyangiaceae bacterium]